jgi:hypothetical protein
MSSAVAAVYQRLVEDENQWRNLVRASVYAVLNAREDLLPKSARLTVDVCEGGMDTMVLRAEGPPRCAAFIKWLREHAVHDAASSALFEAALAASREEWRKHPEGVCAFSGSTTAADLRQVTLFGNSAAGRTESTHVVSGEGWDTFVMGLVVLGGWWRKWLDSEVVLAIPPTTRSMSAHEVDALALKLRPRMDALHHTAECLYKHIA